MRSFRPPVLSGFRRFTGSHRLVTLRSGPVPVRLRLRQGIWGEWDSGEVARKVEELVGEGATAAPGLAVLVAWLGEAAREASLKLAGDLRGAGISAVAATGGKSLKAQLRQANALGVRYTVIIGDDEVKAGTVSLREMATSRQETVPAAGLPERLKNAG